MDLCLSLIVWVVKYGSVGQEWFFSPGVVPVKICFGEEEWEDGKKAMLMILPLCLAMDDSPQHGDANNPCVDSNTYAHANTCKSTSCALQWCIFEPLKVTVHDLAQTDPEKTSASSLWCCINVKLEYIWTSNQNLEEHWRATFLC